MSNTVRIANDSADFERLHADFLRKVALVKLRYHHYAAVSHAKIKK